MPRTSIPPYKVALEKTHAYSLSMFTQTATGESRSVEKRRLGGKHSKRPKIVGLTKIVGYDKN